MIALMELGISLTIVVVMIAVGALLMLIGLAVGLITHPLRTLAFLVNKIAALGGRPGPDRNTVRMVRGGTRRQGLEPVVLRIHMPAGRRNHGVWSHRMVPRPAHARGTPYDGTPGPDRLDTGIRERHANAETPMRAQGTRGRHVHPRRQGSEERSDEPREDRMRHESHRRRP